MENIIKYIFNSTHKIFDDEQFDDEQWRIELNTSSIAHTKYLTTSNGEYN